MSSAKIDTTAFVNAILNNDSAEQSRVFNQILPALVGYLKATFSAEHDDALDACQEVFIRTIDEIKSGKIEKPEALFSYLRTATRNEYFRLKRGDNFTDEEIDFDSIIDSDGFESENPEALLEEERLKILTKCIGELNKSYRTFIRHIMRNLEKEAEDIAKYFKMSLENFWVKKSRIIKKLQWCAEKSLEN